MKKCDTYHHLVDSVDYVEHLVLGNVSVIVHVIETESPWDKRNNFLTTRLDLRCIKDIGS